MKRANLFTGIILLMLCSCDPMRRINMKNNTSEKAEITWFIKEDSISSSPFFISSSREVNFKMQPAPGSKRIKMSFGMGKWTQAQVTDLVDDLDSVVLKWKENVAVLASQEQMETYLMSRRRGLDKSKIHITFTEDQD
jgi:hypothetical protein